MKMWNRRPERFCSLRWHRRDAGASDHFQGSSLWAFGAPVNHEKSGGAGLSARCGHKLMVRKTHPTDDFSEQFLMGRWPTHKA